MSVSIAYSPATLTITDFPQGQIRRLVPSWCAVRKLHTLVKTQTTVEQRTQLIKAGFTNVVEVLAMSEHIVLILRDQDSVTLRHEDFQLWLAEAYRILNGVEEEDEVPPEESQRLLALAAAQYPVGSVLQHSKGPHYRVKMHSLDHLGMVTIIYEPLRDEPVGRIHVTARTLDQFDDVVNVNGEDRLRFVVVPNDPRTEVWTTEEAQQRGEKRA